MSQLNNTAQIALTNSPFFDPKVIKKALDVLKIAEWNHKWTQSDPTLALQTKQWLPNIDLSKTKQLLKLTKTGLGLCIQFLIGHNWLLRHKRYYLDNPNMDLTCRLCNQEDSTEDAVHLWIHCTAMKINRKRVNAILKLNKHADKVSFTQPLMWSPMQLDRFLTEPSIVQLLSEPGVE